jgi:hypothetical protein
MNRNRSNQRNSYNSDKPKNVKVIRCNARHRPVFEHEVCAQHSTKQNSTETQKNCKNCGSSF